MVGEGFDIWFLSNSSSRLPETVVLYFKSKSFSRVLTFKIAMLITSLEKTWMNESQLMKYFMLSTLKNCISSNVPLISDSHTLKIEVTYESCWKENSLFFLHIKVVDPSFQFKLRKTFCTENVSQSNSNILMLQSEIRCSAVIGNHSRFTCIHSKFKWSGT